MADIESFKLDLASCKSGNASWWSSQIDISTMREKILLPYSSSDLESIFSDKSWINYPSYTYDRRSSNGLGPLLGAFVSLLKDHRPSDFNAGLKKSCGLLHCLFLDHSSGKMRVASARRGRLSKDKRVRLRATKILPVRELKPLVNDPYSPVRSSIIKRLGIDNCYKHFLDDKNSWIKSAAVCAAELNEIPYRDIIESSKEHTGYTGRELLSIISKLNSDELIYLLELPSEVKSPYLREQISNVLSTRLSK